MLTNYNQAWQDNTSLPIKRGQRCNDCLLFTPVLKKSVFL